MIVYDDGRALNSMSSAMRLDDSEDPSFPRPHRLLPIFAVPFPGCLLGLWQMRGFSIFLVLLFGLGPLSALVDGSEDAGLPACCRRDGAHDCAKVMQTAATAPIDDPQPSFTSPRTCPYYPGPSMTILMPAHAITAKATQLHAGQLSTPAPVAEQAAVYFAPNRAHAGRGPPAISLS